MFSKQKKLAALFTLIALLLSAFPACAETESPVIYMLQSPVSGEQKECVGMIRMENGDACENTDAYRITFYIQVDDYGQYYVKPGDVTASGQFKTLVPDEDGIFHGLYYSYGSGMQNDLRAKYIHILLVPKDFVPTLNGFNDALNASLDHVTITRGTDGGVDVSPMRVYEPDYSMRADLPVSRGKIAVNVGFFTSGQPGAEVSKTAMQNMLNALAPFTDTVRFYSASDTVSKAYAMAHGMGFKVIGNAWISGDSAADKKEMDALIEHVNNGLVDLAVVGSETQYAGLVDPDTLIADIQYVRERLIKDIPVTTAETLGIISGSARLRKACDVLFVNSYPVYEGIGIGNASAYIISQLESLQAVANGKQLIVSETGWPTAGSGAATEADAARYFDEMRAWSLESGVNIVYFEAFDEPWKASQETEYGAHWGFMDTGLALKDGYRTSPFFIRAGLGITYAALPGNTERIDAEAFSDCEDLEYLYIPPTVTQIAEDAFDNCPLLTILAEKESDAASWASEHVFPLIILE